MPAFGDVTFKVAANSDPRILRVFLDFVKKDAFVWDTADLHLRFGETLRVTPTDIYQDALLENVKKRNSELIRYFKFTAQSGLYVTITRKDAEGYDEVVIYLGGGNAQRTPKGVTAHEIVELEAILRKELRAVSYSQALSSSLGEGLKEHDQQRESELTRLQELVLSAEERVLEQAASLRSKAEAEYDKLKADMLKQFEAKESELSKREEDLKRRLREIDDRESRHVRRRIRRDLKEEFARRGESLQLTEGTQKLR